MPNAVGSPSKPKRVLSRAVIVNEALTFIRVNFVTWVYCVMSEGHVRQRSHTKTPNGEIAS